MLLDQSTEFCIRSCSLFALGLQCFVLVDDRLVQSLVGIVLSPLGLLDLADCLSLSFSFVIVVVVGYGHATTENDDGTRGT